MKKLIKHKSQWSRSLLAFALVTAAGIFLVFPPQEKAQTRDFPTYTTGTFTFSNPVEMVRPSSPIFFQQGGEPEVKVDLFGNIYVTAIQGVPGGVDLWKSINKGANFVYLGQPDGAQDKCPSIPQCAGLGGGDDQIDVSTGGYLYVSSLWLGNVTMSSSYDGGTGGVAPGQKWEVHPAAAGVPSDDRQWVAAYGPQTIAMTYAATAVTRPPGGFGLFFVKSTDAGKTFGVPVEITAVTALDTVNVEGNLVVDPYTGNFYTTYIPRNQNNVIRLASSTDGGTTWTVTTAYTGPAGTTNRGVFPILAVDRGGNLHLAFTKSDDNATHTNSHVFLASTANPTGASPTWTTAVQVDNGGAAVNTAAQAWIVAGSPGIVDVTWLGSSGTSPNTAPFDWHVFFAQVTNALTGSPTIAQNQAESAQVHDASICFNGGGCASGTRTMLEYYTMTIDLDGNANIVHPNSIDNCPSATCLTNAWFTKQTGGPSAYTPPAPPAPATFAANITLPSSTGDAEPGLYVDSFNCMYADTPGNPDVWKSTNTGASFTLLPTPPVLPTGGGDEDIVTIPSATRPATVYLADLALADVSIRKSTDGGASFFSPGTGGSAGELNASSDRQWIAPDLSGATLTMYEMDHELASEAIRFASSTNDSPWVTITGITDPELQGSTIPNTNPGPVFVNRSNHTVYGVFTSSIPTTNANQPPFGKQPNVWVASGAGSGGAGMPPGPFTDYPIFKGLIDSPTNPAPPPGTQTFGTSTANDFPGGDIDSAGNVYAVWAMNNARTNQYAVWFACSHDGGKNFYGPFQVSAGPGSAEMPWIAGGDNGIVDIVFYQTNDLGDPNTASLHWTTKFAQSLNANSREPVFSVVQASDHIMHFGPICNNGLLCGSGTRVLLDFFKVGIGPDGLANIVYADTGNANSPSHVSFARQNGGPLAKANPTSPTCLPIPPLASVVSRKLHGGTLQADITLPLTGQRGVECRSPGQTGTPGFDYKIVFTFGNNIASGGCGTTSNPPGTVAPGPNANQCTVNLNGLPNAQYTTVTLNSVTDVAGNSGPVSGVIGLLIGDVNGDVPNAPGLVDSGDVFLVRQNTGQATTLTNFRKDINANGLVDSGDVFLTRQHTGSQLPSPP